MFTTTAAAAAETYPVDYVLCEKFIRFLYFGKSFCIYKK